MASPEGVQTQPGGVAMTKIKSSHQILWARALLRAVGANMNPHLGPPGGNAILRAAHQGGASIDHRLRVPHWRKPQRQR